ncbi:MAG: SDR family NAD(P)-dependent oxidoreductase [Nitriliruptorales bacterium]|nr:SDR family NAD(P)-dependent oxidoreductase [Nitriliruptorales bacterium]
MTRTAVVTGASAGIGAATARHLADAGFRVIVGARRLERLESLVADIGDGAEAHTLDVTDDSSVAAFVDHVDRCDVLVNNAGGALGLDAVAEADLDRWQTMYDTNVLGVVRMTQALLPKLRASGDGHVVIVGSIAGIEAYPGGGGYNAAKFGVHAVRDVLRHELLSESVRVTEIAPGLVETEFSLVRFDGDEERAAQVYEGMTPLSADDVADTIRWCVTRPAHVNVDHVLLLPRDQASATRVRRRSD